VPTTPGNDHNGRPERQPPTRHGRGGGHDGFHGGYYHGGYYGPYYGYGFWPSLFWGWYWDDYYWRDPYYGYGYPPYHDRYGRYDRDRDDMGALDLDISPGRTQVFLNGENVGTVDDFDGWPQYLWLPRGTYDLVFYLDGYKTIARQVTVYPGLVIDMDDRMEEGQSTLPQDLQTRTHERRDNRINYERKRSDRIDRGTWDPRRDDVDDDGDDDGGDWHDRADRHERRDGDRADRTDRDDADGRAAAPSGDSGWVRFNVDPDDASVYLDGRFVGTGGELGSMEHGLRVSAGQHHLAVVRPGRKPEESDFQVSAGQEANVTVNLDSGR
jgi:hypothetical protein